MEQNTLEIFEMTIQTRIIVSCAIVLLAYLVDFLCCRLLIPLARRLAAKTAYTWDNYITDSNVLRHAFHLIPPVTFLVALPLLFPETEQWTILLSKGFSIYIIVVACSLACAFVSSLYAISSESEVLKRSLPDGQGAHSLRGNRAYHRSAH